ncbi:MAG: AraC family transcriptional regulator [Spirochaetota bacterium]
MPNVFEDVHFIRQHERIHLPAVPLAVGVTRHHVRTVRRESSSAWCTSIEYCVSGKLSVTINGLSFTIRPGDVYILPRHGSYEVSSPVPERTKKYYLYYERMEIEQLLGMHGLNKTMHIPGCKVLAPVFKRALSIAERFEEAPDSSKNTLLAMAAAAAMNVITHCALAVQYDRQHSRDVLRVKNFIDTHFHAPLTLADVSAASGKSIAHVIRRFKRETGVTPIDYLIMRRVETAAVLLTSTDESLRAIAKRTGFKNEHYFSTVFKLRFGRSPASLRVK